jgi:hypothetical protein
MLAPQPTAADSSRQVPFRWTRADVVTALDNFSAAEYPSQRHYAEQHGIPHTTFNYWTRRHAAAAADPHDSFFLSPAGELTLRRIVLAALTTFQL